MDPDFFLVALRVHRLTGVESPASFLRRRVPFTMMLGILRTLRPVQLLIYRNSRQVYGESERLQAALKQDD